MMAFTEAIGMLFRMFKPAEKSDDNTVVTSDSVSLHRLLFPKRGEVDSSPDGSAVASKFETIKSQLLKEGKLYEDKDFLTMVRPKEICSDAQFYVNSYSRFDIRQGSLGDCWFLASLASLSMNKKLLFQVVPEEQSFDDGKYVGMFHFRFWQFGEWVEIIIDDRLPIVNGKLMYVSSSDENEFWSPLFEKAYAQFRGTTYEVIDGGNPCVAMQDFTGGLTENYFISDATSDFFTILLKAFERNALMTCCTEIHPNTDMKDKLYKAGLYDTHAYSVTKVLNLPTETGVVRLLRIRNPWGHTEWNGAWSDKSAEWKLISDDKKKEADVIDNDDGEFWMCYEDFIDHFSDVQFCHLSSDSTDPKNKLKMASIKGNWIKGITAGGSYEDSESFYCNPQYKFTLKEGDDEDTENKCEIIVGLLQKDIGDKIGFTVCPLHDNGLPPKPLDYEFISPLPLPDTSVLDTTREVSRRYTLNPGSYVIISFTEKPDQEKEFLLRLMSEKNVQITDYDGELHFSAAETRVTTSAIKGTGFSRDLFNSLASSDGTVGAKGLKEIFNLAFNLELEGKQITEDLCKLIIETAGGDRTGRLSYEEFKRLWTRLREWHTAFSVCETDNNTIPRRKLRAALRAAGWTVNVEVIKQLSDRFNLTDDNINFYEFINCLLRVRVMCNEREKALKSGALAASAKEIQTTA